jgi:hypothetical protein
VHVSWSSGEPVVEWRDLRGLRFDDPSFASTVDRAVREPYRLLFGARTPIDELGAVAAIAPTVPPTGFVFHASRCGSTLIANMLGTLDDTIVAAEPPAVDGVLRADLLGRVDDETRRRWLGWTVSGLGQPRVGGERRFFVKFDAWSTRDIALVRSVYPDVPSIFVYRHPAEIVASHMRMRGAHMVPGMLPAGLFGLDPASLADLPAEDYCAKVLASILAAAGGRDPGGCLLVHYDQLPAVVSDGILDHFAVDPSDAERARMREAARLDAKNPSLAFDPTEPGRVWPVTPRIRAVADRWAGVPYARLEELRAAGAPGAAGAAGR